jgi:hypothetical protein
MSQCYNIGDAREAAAVCLQAAATIRKHIRAKESEGGDEIAFCEDIVRQIQLFAQRFGFEPEADWLPERIYIGDKIIEVSPDGTERVVPALAAPSAA